MKKFLFLCLYYIVVGALSNSSMAQKITVTAHLDSAVMRIGEQTNLIFELTQQPSQKVISPLFLDTIIKGLEIVTPVQIDTNRKNPNYLIITQSYVVTSFEDSLLYIPPFPFIAEDGDTVWSKSLSLKVVQPFSIDTASAQITDIKDVFNAKFDWWGLLIVVGWILLGIVIFCLIYYIVQKYILKNASYVNSDPKLILPAHTIALQKLDELKSEQLWQKGRIKDYHTLLTDILREYMEEMYSMRSMEMTSEEILDELHGLRFEQKSAYDGLKQILHLADLVKFAKWGGTPEEHSLSMMNAYLFVNQTKIEEVQPLDESNENSSVKEKED